MIRDRLLIVGSPRKRIAVARYAFMPGNSIARCPVIKLSSSDTALLAKTRMARYLFRDGRENMFVLGYTPLCLPRPNEKVHSNAFAVYDPRHRAVELFAMRAITKRERIICDRHIVGHGQLTGPMRTNFVEVKEAPGKGRGLFALRPISRGTITERYPVIVIPSDDMKRVERTALMDYVLDWGYGHCALPLGFYALHNTTKTGRDTTADLWQSYKDRTATIRARKVIRRGEEITMPYTPEGIAEMSALGQLV